MRWKQGLARNADLRGAPWVSRAPEGAPALGVLHALNAESRRDERKPSR